MKYFTNTYFLVILLLLLAVIDLITGSINIFDPNTDVYSLLLHLRFPKILTGIATGSALSVCGLVLQILFRNPLAGPYVLGISSAASLFASIGIMSTGILSSDILYNIELSLLSIIGAIFGLIIIIMVLQITTHITIVLLIGIMLSQLYGAIQSILSYLSTEYALKTYVIWTMGSIQNTNIYQAGTLFVLSILCLVLILRYTKSLMVYISGDETAQVMGIDIHKMKKYLIIVIAIIVGIITAYCGPVALVGMSIPILVRIINNNANVQNWIIHSFLYGSTSIMLTDIVNQIFFDGAVPLNILISMWGVPLMIWILIRQVKWMIN